MGFKRQILAGLAWASIAFAGSAAAQTPLPSHGSAKGYLVITGGEPDYPRMIALAGGNAAHIVVIPTAAIQKPEDEKMLPPYCSTIFAGMKCTVLHTTDRKVADSPEFVAPLKDATGVYLEGGRQWRLSDAYLGTLTLKEILGVLNRGGVVMGGSAGATIQGSYMVRGSSNPDDYTIMMAPGHEVGFGLITNATIDQHVDERGRENDLAPVMKRHPELLGIGLDQSTSITVHGDMLTCNGPRRAAIWDGKDHNGKGYYYLNAGDSLNLVTRIATFVQTAQSQAQSPAQSTVTDISGTWQGTLHAGRDLRTVVKIARADGGAYKAQFFSIDQGGQTLPVDSVTLDGSTLKMRINLIGGSYEGKLSADGQSISGTWTQGQPLPLNLQRATDETAWTIPPPPPPIPTMADDADPSFDVATIKPNDSGATSMQALIMRGRTFVTRASSLQDLISFAYDVQAKQIVNGPDWMGADRYDIEAIPDAQGVPNTEQMRTMIRKLLANRFELTFHHEKRELSAYVLTVTKSGGKLTPTELKGQLPGFGMRPVAGGITLMVRNAAIPDFTGFLQVIVLDRPVVDRTTLTGRYDFQCTFAPDESEFDGHPPRFPAPGHANPSPGSTTETASAPSLFDAIQQQLGLKLSAEKTAVDVIAIDRVDHPSPN